MMSKKKRSRPQARAEPKQDSAAAWLCSVDAYNVLTAGKYGRMADCPEVRMCVDVYADLISSMTLYLMQNTDKGDVRIKNELSRKMGISPNSLMTRKAWMYNIVWSLMLPGDGNQVTVPHYSKDGLLQEMEPLEPSKVSFEEIPGGYLIHYGSVVYRPDEVLHFVINPDPEKPWMGTGYRAVLRDVVNGLRQASTTKMALMESPAPSLVIKVGGLAEEMQSPEGREVLSSRYLSDKENGRPWFIPTDTFDVEQIKPLTLNDLAIAKNMELDKRTAAGIFGVPPFFVGVGDYNKAAHNHFVNTKIMPKAKAIEQELTRKLLLSPDLYWRFNPRSLYAYDMDEMISAGSAMVDRMAMTRNEWRDMIGMSPREDMEELLGLENYLPVDKLGDQKKLLLGGEGNE